MMTGPIDVAAEGSERYRPLSTKTSDPPADVPSASIVSVPQPFACLFTAPTPAHLHVLLAALSRPFGTVETGRRFLRTLSVRA
jgi:hypothetical protein